MADVQEAQVTAGAPVDESLMQSLANITPSEIYLTGGSGHGSTNTRIRRFTTVATNTGTALSVAQSSTDGDSITVNEYGIYGISYQDGASNAPTVTFGISKNSNQLTTDIGSITGSHHVIHNYIANSSEGLNVAVILPLVPGDVIRAHTSAPGSPFTTANTVKLRIVKINNGTP